LTLSFLSNRRTEVKSTKTRSTLLFSVWRRYLVSSTFDGLWRTRAYLFQTLTAGKMAAINFRPTFRRSR